MQWRGPRIGWIAVLVVCIHAALVRSQGASDLGGNGDECGSGQAFPVEFNGAIIVGCKAFNGANWCKQDDGAYSLCPEFPIIKGEKADTSIEPTIESAIEPTIQADADQENTKKGTYIPKPDDSGISPNTHLSSTPGEAVTITEIMAGNDGYLADDDGQFPDWIEIYNSESKDVSLQGWSVTDDPEEPRKWMFPDLMFVSGGYYVLFASGKDRGTNSEALHTNFRLKSDGDYIALVRPDGTIASSIADEYPRQLPNVSFGLPDLTAFSQPEKFYNSFMYLSYPTPNAANADPLQRGPYISSVSHQHGEEMPPEGEDLAVTAFVAEYLHPVERVLMTYRVNYGEETTVEMNPAGSHAFGADIPSGVFSASDMVRWAITGIDSEGNEAREPPLINNDYPAYHGTVIADPSVQTDIPILHWYSPDPALATSQEGGPGSLYYDGYFYDNAMSRRRGATALTWPKPKIKFDFKGKVFKLAKHHSVEEINLQSFWEEPGEDTYMREPVAFDVLREAGVPAPQSFHVHVRQNAVYYGLFAFVEQVDDSFLEQHGKSTAGMLFKARTEDSNLRWDVEQENLQYFYREGNPASIGNWWALYALNQALGGGGTVPRSTFLIEYLNVPEIINYMAVNNLLLNQDRCTKNFYMYRDATTERWTIFPWDTESAMGISSGLGGEPAPDYCLLVCEQWNSPLFCDSDHPQDVPLQSSASTLAAAGRRLFQTQEMEQRMQPREYPIPSPEEYDTDRTSGPAPTGPYGNYHHLDDAILDHPVTRAMYLRRLRTLMDQFLQGRLREIIDGYYNRIRDEAIKDNQQWNVTDDPTAMDRGYQQLIEEQLPKRRSQLYDTYGPSGPLPLIPEAQPQTPKMQIAGIDTEAESPSEQYIHVHNPNQFSVDMSSWRLLGSAMYTFPPGTVALPNGDVLISPNIPAFRNRAASPRGGEGHFVLGTYTAIDPSAPVTLSLTTASGATVATYSTSE